MYYDKKWMTQYATMIMAGIPEGNNVLCDTCNVQVFELAVHHEVFGWVGGCGLLCEDCFKKMVNTSWNIFWLGGEPEQFDTMFSAQAMLRSCGYLMIASKEEEGRIAQVWGKNGEIANVYRPCDYPQYRQV